MDDRHRKWETAGLLLTLIAGNLLHFVYGWSGSSPVAAAFSAVNESTWEHMKLLAVPWIAWSLAEAVSGGGAALFPRALGLLAGLIAIPAAFYTYSGATGQAHHLVNILIFQLSVLLAFAVSRWARESKRFQGGAWRLLGLAVLLAVGALFLRWTYRAPDLPLFTDPATGLTGIPLRARTTQPAQTCPTGRRIPTSASFVRLLGMTEQKRFSPPVIAKPVRKPAVAIRIPAPVIASRAAAWQSVFQRLSLRAAQRRGNPYSSVCHCEPRSGVAIRIPASVIAGCAAARDNPRPPDATLRHCASRAAARGDPFPSPLRFCTKTRVYIGQNAEIRLKS